jgi:hypothetical protein
MPTERPQLVGVVSAQLLRIEERRVVSTAHPLQPYSRFSRPESLFFLSISSSIVL